MNSIETAQRRLLALTMLLAMQPKAGLAAEAGQGTFHTTLDEHPIHCASGGPPITTGYVTVFSFDDKTFHVPLPGQQDQLELNFSLLGACTSDGELYCEFDEGGTFQSTATNETGDFQWTELRGEYTDHVPGVAEGHPFPFVGTARCATSRTDDFGTLCDDFELSFNGLSKALAPNAEGYFHDFAGDFTMRAVRNVRVPSSVAPQAVESVVDGPGGDLPRVEVVFQNGVSAPGDLRVATLADARGTVPPGVAFPTRGTTTIDHGAGPVPFFEGGDERFVELTTDAALPAVPSLEVCLPLPPISDPSQVRPVRVLHGEEQSGSRAFVDRTSRVDPSAGVACARVSSFSKFALVTTDVCGGGQRTSDGLVTVAGGLIGKRTVVVDGLTDCAQYPATLPWGLQKYCVPDADATAGRCAVSITLGVNRAGCNLAASASPSVDVSSYGGELRQGGASVDLTGLFGPMIAALGQPLEATVGPVNLTLPVVNRITTYKLRHRLSGARPGDPGRVDMDRDVLTLKCLDPT